VLLSPRQQAALLKLKKEAVVMFPEGKVDAVNAAVLMNKCLQICAGCVYTSEPKEVVNLGPENRIDTVMEMIEASASKAIVVAPYIHVLDYLCEQLSTKYKVAKIMGSVPAKSRTKIFRSFQDRRDPLRVIVAHPKVLAHGLNLTAASTIVWYSPIYSREIYEQVNGRITRLGQDLEQLIVHLSSGKEEDAAYRVVEHKGTMQDMVLEVFELRMSGPDLSMVIDEPEVEFA
jgi:SNF2 family DNA or RNA helicase